MGKTEVDLMSYFRVMDKDRKPDLEGPPGDLYWFFIRSNLPTIKNFVIANTLKGFVAREMTEVEKFMKAHIEGKNDLSI